MPRTFKESFTVTGAQLVDAVRRLLHEGNVRRVIIKQDGRSLVEFPLTIGVIGAVFAPVLAAAGAVAAVLGDCTIEVEREVPDAPQTPAAPPGPPTNQGPGTAPGSGGTTPGSE
jgi:hypothetical protein